MECVTRDPRDPSVVVVMVLGFEPWGLGQLLPHQPLSYTFQP